MTVQPSKLFAFGLGYSSQAVAVSALHQGWQVAGTVRRAEKAAQLRGDGIDARVWSAGGVVGIWEGAHWLISVPPGAQGCPVALAMADRAASAASVTYLSTTGVYGDLGGGWAFEWSATSPGSERGRRRVCAEQQWLDATDGKARLVRLPGIYGPGRSALDRVRKGTARAIVKPGQVFSRVHVGDIASGIMALLERPELSGVFHLCDGDPAPPQEVIFEAARLLGAPRPAEVAFADADLSDMARSFYSECKRVSNARTRAQLGWAPRYRDYRAGLAAILATDQAD